MSAVELLLSLAKDNVNSKLPELPQRWGSHLMLEEYLREPGSALSDNLLSTPLFIAMHSAYTRHHDRGKSIDHPDDRAHEKDKICADLRPVYTAFFQTGLVNLAHQYSTGAMSDTVKTIQMFLISRCCNEMMVKRMALSGFIPPWDVLKFEDQYQLSPRVFSTKKEKLPTVANMDISGFEVTEAIMLYFQTNKCRFADLITQNFELAKHLIRFEIVKAANMDMTMPEEGRVWQILEGIDSEVIMSLIIFGVDRDVLLRGATRNGKFLLLNTLSLTAFFGQEEVMGAAE